MSQRKIKVDVIQQYLDGVNRFLLESPDNQRWARHFVADMLERILLDNGRYFGYRYLTENDMNRNNFSSNTAGVVQCQENIRQCDILDDTRRKYN